MALLRKTLLMKGGGGGVKVFGPSAGSYFDTIGEIWSQEAGSYFDYKTGEVALFVDAPPSQQGAYFDRV